MNRGGTASFRKIEVELTIEEKVNKQTQKATHRSKKTQINKISNRQLNNMSSMTIVMAAAVEAGMRKASVQFAQEVLRELSEAGALNIGLEKATQMFNFEEASVVSKRSAAVRKVRAKQKKASKASKAPKTAKPEALLPFCGVIVDDWCKGVRFNHGLHTQCTNAMVDGRYCNTCSKSATNSASSKPTYGDIEDRAPLGAEYRDPKGKLTQTFGSVAAKEGLDIEAAKAAAAKMGWTIPAAQLVVRKVHRGRPAKSAAASDTDSAGSGSVKVKRGRKPKIVIKAKTQDDLIAKLVAEAADEAISGGSCCSSHGGSVASSTPKSATSGTSKVSKAEKVAAIKAEITAAATPEWLAENATLESVKTLKELRPLLRAAKKAAKIAAQEAAKKAKAAAKAAERAQKAAVKLAAKKAAQEAAKVTKLTAQLNELSVSAAQIAECDDSVELRTLLQDTKKQAKKDAARRVKVVKELHKFGSDEEETNGKSLAKLEGLLRISKEVAAKEAKAAKDAAKAAKKEAAAEAAAAAAAEPELEAEVVVEEEEEEVVVEAAKEEVVVEEEEVVVEAQDEAEDEQEAEEEVSLTEDMIVEARALGLTEYDGAQFYMCAYAGYDNFLFTLEGQMFAVYDPQTKTVQEVEEDEGDDE
jgi:hypothetical protein